MEKPKIAVFGDVLLDRYDYCENRENPESSAPCHCVRKTTFLPGGAGNVAANLAKLGADVILFGLIGKDEPGQQLLKEISRLDITSKLLTDEKIKTIVKQRILSAHDGRYHGRLDFGDDHPEIAQRISLDQEITRAILPQIANGFDACVISDYEKGFVTPALVAQIKSLGVPVYVDPKNEISQFYGVELIKPNRKEISSMSRTAGDKQKAEDVASRLNTNVLLTLGEQGMYFVGKNGESFHLPAHKTEVVDVTGCGDTAIATLVFYRTLGKSMKEAVELANKAAGLNVQHVGCYSVSREEIEK